MASRIRQRAWLAYIRAQLRLAYGMNRQLLADSDVSPPDYDVLTALRVADGERMPITCSPPRSAGSAAGCPIMCGG
jgi:hypothetical protein